MTRETSKTRNHLNPFLVALLIVLFFGVPVAIHSQEPKPEASVDKLTTKDFEPQKKPVKSKPQRNIKPKAADLTPVSGQTDPGVLYERGQYFFQKKDYREAMSWFLKAAEQGNTLAQSAIGLMYQNGLGVKKDNKEAMKWYLKASQQAPSQAGKPEAVKPETVKQEPLPQVPAATTLPPALPGARPQETSSASVPLAPQTNDTQIRFQPFLGEWKGECEFTYGIKPLGSKSCRLVVYIEGGGGYVDCYVGSTQLGSTQSVQLGFFGSQHLAQIDIGEPSRQNKIKAEVRNVNGSPCLMFSTTANSSSWLLEDGKLRGQIVSARFDSQCTLSKVK